MEPRLLLVTSALIALTACTFGPPKTDAGITDTAGGPDDSGFEEWEKPECDPEPVSGFALPEGNYTLSIDEEVFNDCHNEAGNGLHIHVGEDQTVAFTQDQTCVEAVSEPGGDMEMVWGGTTDGQTFELEGFVELAIGTCSIGIDAVMTGQMTGHGSFTYRIDATAGVYQEHSPDACQMIIGDTEDHTFGELPCDQAWTGVGTL